MNNYILIPIIIGLLAVLFAAYLANYVLRKDTGTPAMQKVANAIFSGAMAFLNRQYRTIAALALVAAIVVGLVLYLLSGGSEADKFDLAWRTGVAFLIGATCSGVAGYIGMYVAVKSNSRTASAATRSLGEALMVSLRGGAVSGFLVVALSLLGVSLIFLVYTIGNSYQNVPSLIVGFGFGASFVALFAQLGGGIFTKAADVGADLVGKVEANIPEDDPRNPAVIADLVGDNVGDCAGRGADLFESTAAENIGAMILGVSIFAATGYTNPGWILFPLVVRAFGLIASAVGLLYIRPSIVVEPDKAAGRDPGEIAMNQLNIGYYITCILSVGGVFLASYLLLNEGPHIVGNNGVPAWVWFGLAGVVGIVLSVAFVYITQYYTAGTWRPVREIAAATLTGPATTIITGIAVAFECVALPVLAISGALGLSYFLGSQVTIVSPINPGIINIGGIFGTAVATMGMLMSCAYILAMDTFGPITDNAGGITEMGGGAESVRDITDALDGVGNTTKALTKGYGIGSAALAAFLLFSAYLDVLYKAEHKAAVYDVDLANIAVFVAALIGITLIFFFSALAIRAVGAAAKRMIEEVRRQFRENPKIMAENPADRVDPDYARCVDISTRGALRAMVLPGLIAVFTPIAVGVILGTQAAASMLMVGTMGGIVLALFLNNGGGAWDNAKKYIEAGYLRVNAEGEMVDRLDPNGTVLGKKSEAHKAGVVGDTVGDPFKDTAGPSLHVLIKLLSTITLVLAPLYIALHPI